MALLKTSPSQARKFCGFLEVEKKNISQRMEESIDYIIAGVYILSWQRLMSGNGQGFMGFDHVTNMYLYPDIHPKLIQN